MTDSYSGNHTQFRSASSVSIPRLLFKFGLALGQEQRKGTLYSSIKIDVDQSPVLMRMRMRTYTQAR